MSPRVLLVRRGVDGGRGCEPPPLLARQPDFDPLGDVPRDVAGEPEEVLEAVVVLVGPHHDARRIEELGVHLHAVAVPQERRMEHPIHAQLPRDYRVSPLLVAVPRGGKVPLHLDAAQLPDLRVEGERKRLGQDDAR
jgi:hypothetical protein